jgi:autotransporter-associated beta strand protein
LETSGAIITPIVDKGSGSGAVFNFNGGVLRARGSGTVITNYMRGLVAAKVLAGGAVIDSSNNAVTVAQSLQSGATLDGGLTKRGTGTLTLSGVNTYNGATRIEEGTLKLGNAAGVPIDGDVTVAEVVLDLGG